MSRTLDSPIGVVAALRSEARCLAPRVRTARGQLLVEVSGMGCERAARAAFRLVQAGARALLCWGVAGALDPALRCGDVLLAGEVISEGPLALQVTGMRPTALPAGARLRTSETWRTELMAALLRSRPVMQGAVLTSPGLVCDVGEKSRRFRATRALAVDMESAAVGAVAALHGLPFLVLRAIVDTAADALPGPLRSLADPNPLGPLGFVTWLPLLGAPRAWPALVRLGRRYGDACAALRGCAPQLSGPTVVGAGAA